MRYEHCAKLEHLRSNATPAKLTKNGQSGQRPEPGKSGSKCNKGDVETRKNSSAMRNNKTQYKNAASKNGSIIEQTLVANPATPDTSGVRTRSRLNASKIVENSPKGLPRGRPPGSIAGIGTPNSRRATTRAEIEAGRQRTLNPLNFSLDEGGSHDNSAAN